MGGQKMTKKQFIIISIISAILTGDFMYLIIYFPNELFEFLFWAVSTAFCFVFFYLIVLLIWTKGDILPDPYPTIYMFDPDIEEKLKEIEERKKKEKKNGECSNDFH